MKKILFMIIGFFSGLMVAGQVPQAISYQAIARDGNGLVLASKEISVEVTLNIIREAGSGSGSYTETHQVTTDPTGMYRIEIGRGDPVYGDFTEFEWSCGSVDLQIKIDPEGGTNYQFVSITLLLSVPYAFYTESSGMDYDWLISSGNMTASVSGNVGIGTNNPQKKLSLIGGLRVSKDETDTDYLQLVHGPDNGVIKWNGSGNLDFRYDENTIMRMFPDGRVAMGENYAASSALLQLNSTTKGFRPPTMNAEKVAAISGPKGGLMAYNKSDDHLYVFREDQNYKWQQLKYDDVTIEPWECGEELIDFRDQKTYETVQIGDQCWMAENLNIGERIDGSEDMTDNGTIEKYCYGDVPANCGTYGGLYEWNEMMQYITTAGVQGICPAGWHLPTDDEWKILEGNADSHYPAGDPEWDTTGYRGFDVGLNLKSTSGWNSNGNGTDLFGFSALPGGRRLTSGNFDYQGYYGYWWSSSESSDANAWYRKLDFNYGRSSRFFYSKGYGFSVRCLRD